MFDFDVVVVGAGIFGTCTAFHCQKLGLRTLLLEKYPAGHQNGSSHGKSRVTRYAHTEGEYVPLVSDAYKQIADLEKKRNEKLWKKTGLLWAATGNKVQQISNVLKQQNIQHEVIDAVEIGKRYPQFSFDNRWTALIDPMGGLIYADKQLSAFREEFIALGGTFHDNEGVESYTDGNPVRISTGKGTYTAKKTIFTVGGWISEFFPKAPMKVEPVSISVCYWKTKRDEDCHLLTEEKMPVFIGDDSENEQFTFALPDADYPKLIKFVYHGGDPIVNFEHPVKVSEKYISVPQQLLQGIMPIIDAREPVIIDKCKYTFSEDRHYVIGPYPGSQNVLVGGCGSGSGFKVAPAIGRALAEMAAGQKPSVDVSFFSFDRFKNSKL